MERGKLSEEREPDCTEHFDSMELVRLAMPRLVFMLSQIEYVIDRVKWVYDHKHMIGGLRFVHEPEILILHRKDRAYTGLKSWLRHTRQTLKIVKSLRKTQK